MYLRRHCYDKAHRCPGRNGGGFKYPVLPKGTPEPDWYRELREEDPERFEPWEQSNLVQQHWWQQLERCDRGLIYMPYGDPWRMWRWGRCNRCDIRAIPMVSRYLDPKWLWWEMKSFFRYGDWRDLMDHKRYWRTDGLYRAPWWSPFYAMKKVARYRWFHVTEWFRDLYNWYRPGADRGDWHEEWLAAGRDR